MICKCGAPIRNFEPYLADLPNLRCSTCGGGPKPILRLRDIDTTWTPSKPAKLLKRCNLCSDSIPAREATEAHPHYHKVCYNHINRKAYAAKGPGGGRVRKQ
jgi:hypothetical protein